MNVALVTDMRCSDEFREKTVVNLHKNRPIFSTYSQFAQILGIHPKFYHFSLLMAFLVLLSLLEGQKDSRFSMHRENPGRESCKGISRYDFTGNCLTIPMKFTILC